MGITGLARRLEPYSCRLTVADLSGYKAIVDGPSLAYHAHKLALADAGNQACIPSYTEINQQALRWLRALEDINIKVSAILFDGVLPETKIDERLSRLNKSNRRVGLLRIQYPNSSCPIPSSLGSIAYSLLAPALREALNDSEYASVTRLVHGEADDYCAPCANDTPRSIIFSSDSDLLLYEYHADCRIILFNDVELWPEPTFKGYSPVQIGKSLGLASLVPFAFCLAQDKWLSTTDLVQYAKETDAKIDGYEDFRIRYKSPQQNRLQSAVHQHLDVRISEFMAQVQDGITTPVTYLPLLVEDPNASSAWSIGQEIRLLAYSLVATRPSFSHTFFGLGEKHQMVEEYRRKAQMVSIHQLQLHKLAELSTVASELARNIGSWVQWMGERQVPNVWPLIAANLVLLDVPTAPKISLFIRALNGDFNSSWNFIHLTARLHAAIYSLRMLKQCVEIWLSTHQNTTAEPHQHVDMLDKCLGDMPSIAELFLVPGQAKQKQIDDESLKELLEAMYASAQIDVPDEKLSNKKMKKQQREAEKKEKRRKVEEGQRSFNVFDLLNREC